MGLSDQGLRHGMRARHPAGVTKKGSRVLFQQQLHCAQRLTEMGQKGTDFQMDEMQRKGQSRK
jgi:hypothetical protein